MFLAQFGVDDAVLGHWVVVMAVGDGKDVPVVAVAVVGQMVRPPVDSKALSPRLHTHTKNRSLFFLSFSQKSQSVSFSLSWELKDATDLRQC